MFKDNSNPTPNEGHWQFQAINSEFRLNAQTDAGSNTIAMRVTRNAGVADEFIFNRPTTVSGNINLGANTPKINFHNTAGDADEKNWYFEASGDTFTFSLTDDTDAGDTDVYSVTRNGTTPS